jgi:hypothetical protein
MQTESTSIEVNDLPAVTLEQQVAPPPEQTAELEGEPKQVESKTFTQEQLNEIIQAEKAKAEAKAERRALKAYRETLERIVPQQPKQAQTDNPLSRSNFDSDEAYVDALVEEKIQKRERATQQDRAAQAEKQTHSKIDRLYQDAEKLTGFDKESFEEVLHEHGTPVMAQALIESDVSAQLMAWMSGHPDDVERISKLSPARQAAEIGKVEAKLSVPRVIKDAPTPIKTVSGAGAVSNGDPSKMSQEEYMAMRKKQGARWAN